MPPTPKDWTTSIEGQNISAVLTCPDGAVRAAVLLVHGLGGQKNSDTHLQAAEALKESGIASLRFDFPGHGESGGGTETLTIGSGAAVVDGMFDRLIDAFPDCPAGLLGASFGGSCILASGCLPKAGALVLRSPVSDYCAVRKRQLGEAGLARWRRENLMAGMISRGRLSPWRFYEEAEQLDLYARAGNARGALLIVHGTADDTVPLEQSVKLRHAWGGQADLVTIADGNHSLEGEAHTGLFVAMGADWFRRLAGA